MLAVACSSASTNPTPDEPSAPPGSVSPAASSQGASDGASSEQSASQPASASAPEVDKRKYLVPSTPKDAPPKLDTSIASVSLDEVVFDTFRGGFIRLSEADDRTIDNLRDRIKPIYEPKYDSVEGGDWLYEHDQILGYVSDSGEAFAYPFRILNFHEIVNDLIDNVPVLISYCPLCASAVVYSRELDDDVLLFGNTSALFESDLVMFDHNTGSYWFQVLGEAIVGPQTGKRLKVLPSMNVTWPQWKELHPNTKVLSRDLGLLPGDTYGRDPFAGFDEQVNSGRFAFPVSEDKLDDRLSAGDRVLTIEIGGVAKAYLLSGREDQVTNDEIAGEKVAVIIRSEGPSAAAFLSTFDGQVLTFSLNSGVIEDAETGSQWDDSGRAVSGPLTGSQLTLLPSRTSFWFSIVGALPDIEVHKGL